MNANISRNLRHIVFERDSYTCVLCERGATDAHHVIPRSRGGRNVPHNLVSLCRPHHMKLHHTLPVSIDEYEDAQQLILEYICDYYPMECARELWHLYNMDKYSKNKP